MGMGFLFGVLKCSKMDCGDGCTTLKGPLRGFPPWGDLVPRFLPSMVLSSTSTSSNRNIMQVTYVIFSVLVATFKKVKTNR